MKKQILSMLTKVVSKRVSREEGAMLLNDLMRLCCQFEQKEKLRRFIGSLCADTPRGLHPKTLYHIIALANNSDYDSILITGLHHENEEICIVCAEGLAKHRGTMAKEALVTHLTNPSYHSRKIAADTLCRMWGKEGVRLIVDHAIVHPDHFIRDTAAQVLCKYTAGVSALLDVLDFGSPISIQTSVEYLSKSRVLVTKADTGRIFRALEINDEAGQEKAVMFILRLISFLGTNVNGYEARVSKFLQSSHPHIRDVAREALNAIGTVTAKSLVAAADRQPVKETYFTEEPDLMSAKS